MAFLSSPPDKSLFKSDFLSWKSKLSNFIKYKDPESYHWFLITESYELPRFGGTLEDGTTQVKSRSQMSVKELEDFDKDSSVYKLITMCLPNDVIISFTNNQSLSSIELWDKLTEVYGLKKSPNVVIKEDVMVKKDKEIKALQVKLLIMKNQHEELKSKVIGLEKKIAEYEDQQLAMDKLKEDHERAFTTIQVLREKLAKVSQSSKSHVKKKKKISQFTNYSLQKNKKYSEKSQSRVLIDRFSVQVEIHWINFVNSSINHRFLENSRSATVLRQFLVRQL